MVHVNQSKPKGNPKNKTGGWMDRTVKWAGDEFRQAEHFLQKDIINPIENMTLMNWLPYILAGGVLYYMFYMR